MARTMLHCVFATWRNFLATRVNRNLAVIIPPHFNTPFLPILWERGKSLVWLASSRLGYHDAVRSQRELESVNELEESGCLGSLHWPTCRVGNKFMLY